MMSAVVSKDREGDKQAWTSGALPSSSAGPVDNAQSIHGLDLAGGPYPATREGTQWAPSGHTEVGTQPQSSPEGQRKHGQAPQGRWGAVQPGSNEPYRAWDLRVWQGRWGLGCCINGHCCPTAKFSDLGKRKMDSKAPQARC